MLKHLLLSAAAVGLTASASFAGPISNSYTGGTITYGNLRVTQIVGGRNITIAQRLDRGETPYALTGRDRDNSRVDRQTARPERRTPVMAQSGRYNR